MNQSFRNGGNYSAYIRSFKWQNMRRDMIRLRDGKCDRCGGQATELRHKNYERFGRELTSDLEVLCWFCSDQRNAR